MNFRLIDDDQEEFSNPPARPPSLYSNTINLLHEMGFTQEFIEVSISYTNSYNINELLSFMIKGEQGWDHEFIRNNYKANETNRCEICKDPAEEHATFVVPPPISTQNRQEEIKSIQDRLSILFSSIDSEDLADPVDQCNICLYSIHHQYTLDGCSEHAFCLNCVQKYLEILINDSKVMNIKCPGVVCGKEFTENDIESLVSKEVFLKYLKFKKRSELLLDPSIKWCIRPDCEGYVTGCERDALKECPVCYMKICFKCGKEWHPKKSCDDVIDADYEVWAKGREVLPCPKCKHKIEKIDGCNHMTCAVCGYNWCWLCRGKYTSNHFSNMNPLGCPNLQSGFNTRDNWPMWKIYCARLKGICFWLLIIIFSPLIILFGPAVQVTTSFNRNNYYRGFCWLAFCDILVFIGILALTPLGYALGIPLSLIYLLVKCLRR